jgi:hypothetical protein
MEEFSTARVQAIYGTNLAAFGGDAKKWSGGTGGEQNDIL